MSDTEQKQTENPIFDTIEKWMKENLDSKETDTVFIEYEVNADID